MSLKKWNSAPYVRTCAVVVIAHISLDQAWSQEAEQLDGPASSAEVIENLPSIDVIVTSPSPVKKKRRTTPKPQASSVSPGTQSAPVATELLPVAPLPVANQELRGALAVADDTFASVTIVDEDAILTDHGANLTESLAQKPGISGSTFSAGSSRPIIRGLDNNRVRVQENGIGTHDVFCVV